MMTAMTTITAVSHGVTTQDSTAVGGGAGRSDLGRKRIGSLFSGVGGLDLAVEAYFGGTTVWQCENNPEARKVLHRRFGVRVYEDITTIDWRAVPAIDILAGGFPCQDVSSAGLRKGMGEGTRSGLWRYFAEGIDYLRPKLVVIENVKGLLTLKGTDGRRAVDIVLDDLGQIGYDHRMGVFKASDAGAPHKRERVFILARPKL
jgi:DNA-cytosine methyltransferase